MATYLYGIVHRPAQRLPWGQGIGSPPQPLRTISYGSIAALASDVSATEPESEGRALRRDLHAHEQAVRRAMSLGTVLPVSFGTIFDDDRQLIGELLEPNAEELAALLREFEGLVELSLKAELVEDAALRRLLDGDAELRAWRDMASFGGTNEQIAFGQAIAESVEEEAGSRAERLLARLAPLAEDFRATAKARGTIVLKAAFLVDEQQIGKFDGAMEELAAEAAPLVRFDYIGPLPPYSFVHLNLHAPSA